MEPPKKWQRAELLLFSVLTLLFALPFLSTHFFPSMDGASHLANSNIINQLVIHHNDLFERFFKINPEPVPNWTGHLFISALKLILPAFLAEKLLIFLLLAGIPFAFRYLLFTISPKRTLYSFLIFPFTHSMFLFFGFYNFCLAILFFIITLNYWLHHEQHIFRIKHLVWLTILVALTYFSHIVIFGTLLILIGTHILAVHVAAIICSANRGKPVTGDLIRKAAAICIAAIIPLMLFGWFFYSRPETREIKFLSTDELISILTSIRPLISLNPEIEGKYLRILFIAFIFVVISGLAGFLIRLVRRRSNDNDFPPVPERLLPRVQFWWLLSSIIILKLLFFILPDAYGTASYTNLRIAFVLFLVMILWFSTFRIPWAIGVVAVVAAMYVNIMLIRFYRPSLEELGKLASSCNKAADFVEPNSIILPIYCLDNWFTGHFVDYIAVDKPVVMVYNYECESGYFPVSWNLGSKPNYYLGNPETPEKHINFEVLKGAASIPLNYVFIVGHYDPGKDWFFGTLHSILTTYFDKVYEAENCSLYRNRMARAYVR